MSNLTIEKVRTSLNGMTMGDFTFQYTFQYDYEILPGSNPYTFPNGTPEFLDTMNSVINQWNAPKPIERITDVSEMPIVDPTPEPEPIPEPRLTSCMHERHLFTLKERNVIVKNIIKILKPHVDTFDAIVISGYSMAMISPIIADKLKKNIVLVRKKSENRHSGYTSEGLSHQRCIFIDDCISSGTTFRYVEENLKEIHCTIDGIVLYNDSDNREGYRDVPYLGVFRI